MPGRGNIRGAGTPPRVPPKSVPVHPGDRPPLQQLALAAAELFRVLTECAEELLDDFREERSNKS